MKLERVWKNELQKRRANTLRKERVNRNWPIHAQRAVEVFQAFALEARKDGVDVFITKPEWSPPPNQIGEFITGATSIHLRLGAAYTGEGVFTRDADGRENYKIDVERGSVLIIHHSPSEGLIQVFFEHPTTNLETERREPLLFTHTFNSDDVNSEWLMSLISSFLSFNRVESQLEHASFLDYWRMRWWQFTDVRNQRGYLDKFQHLLTPWELVLLGGIVAVPGFAVTQWLWGKL